MPPLTFCPLGPVQKSDFEKINATSARVKTELSSADFKIGWTSLPQRQASNTDHRNFIWQFNFTNINKLCKALLIPQKIKTNRNQKLGAEAYQLGNTSSRTITEVKQS